MSSLTKKYYRLDVRSPGELIDAYPAHRTVTGFGKGRNIPRETCWLAGYIEDLFHAVSQDLGKRLRMHTVPRWVKGSRMIRSGFSSISSRTFSTSPAINSQLSMPFLPAFSAAASTASFTISTPITFSDTGAMSWEIVPVPQ